MAVPLDPNTLRVIVGDGGGGALLADDEGDGGGGEGPAEVEGEEGADGAQAEDMESHGGIGRGRGSKGTGGPNVRARKVRGGLETHWGREGCPRWASGLV
jgi:hypothetical protein